MKTEEVIHGQDYSSAVELRLREKYLKHINGTQKSSASGTSGTKNKDRQVPAAAQGVFREQQKRDRLITQDRQRVLVIVNGKRRWMLYSQLPG